MIIIITIIIMDATTSYNNDHIPLRDREDAPPRGTDWQWEIIKIITLFLSYLFSDIGPAGCAERLEECNPGSDSSEVSSKA